MSLSKEFERRRSFRAFFAAKWSSFLRENYRSPEEVSVAYGVRYQSALNWWNGDNAPSGFAVAMAFYSHPEGAQKALGISAEV
jgi:hypothetical protein